MEPQFSTVYLVEYKELKKSPNDIQYFRVVADDFEEATMKAYHYLGSLDVNDDTPGSLIHEITSINKLWEAVIGVYEEEIEEFEENVISAFDSANQSLNNDGGVQGILHNGFCGIPGTYEFDEFGVWRVK